MSATIAISSVSSWSSFCNSQSNIRILVWFGLLPVDRNLTSHLSSNNLSRLQITRRERSLLILMKPERVLSIIFVSNLKRSEQITPSSQIFVSGLEKQNSCSLQARHLAYLVTHPLLRGSSVTRYAGIL